MKSTKIEEEKENQPSDSNSNFSLHKKFDGQISLYRVKL